MIISISSLLSTNRRNTARPIGDPSLLSTNRRSTARPIGGPPFDQSETDPSLLSSNRRRTARPIGGQTQVFYFHANRVERSGLKNQQIFRAEWSTPVAESVLSGGVDRAARNRTGTTGRHETERDCVADLCSCPESSRPPPPHPLLQNFSRPPPSSPSRPRAPHIRQPLRRTTSAPRQSRPLGITFPLPAATT